jgi:SAM-dependent methyltransferase
MSRPDDGTETTPSSQTPSGPPPKRSFPISRWLILVACLTLAAGLLVQRRFYQRESQILANIDQSPPERPLVDAPFITTPQDIVEKMLELADVKGDDLVYDLGCGDGRIVVTAAAKSGCRAVGYDNNPERVREALENVKKNGVEELVTISQEDIFSLDLTPANVVTLYLLPRLNVKLIPQLEKLPPGSRIVSHDFNIEGVKPDKVVSQRSDEDGRIHDIYLWTTPLNRQEAN